jgi:hypothetical protein
MAVADALEALVHERQGEVHPRRLRRQTFRTRGIRGMRLFAMFGFHDGLSMLQDNIDPAGKFLRRPLGDAA